MAIVYVLDGLRLEIAVTVCQCMHLKIARRNPLALCRPSSATARFEISLGLLDRCAGVGFFVLGKAICLLRAQADVAWATLQI